MEHNHTGQNRPGPEGLQSTHLFTLRLWQEQLGGGEAEWRGRVQDITSGEIHYFRDWSGLVAILSRLVATKPSDYPSTGKTSSPI